MRHLIAALVVLCALCLPVVAQADIISTELVSTGPLAPNSDDPASVIAISPDGERVLFFTAEALTLDDGDVGEDLYRWEAGKTELVSTNGLSSSEYEAASKDLSRVFFNTTLQLDPQTDTDGGAYDVYERSGGQWILASTGPDNANTNIPASFNGISATGDRVWFTTSARLVTSADCAVTNGEADDCDGAFDVYERSQGQTTLVSTSPADVHPTDPSLGDAPASMDYSGASADGEHVLFRTTATLSATDLDAGGPDLYERASGATELVSTGPADPSTQAGQALTAVSDDGSAVFFHTALPLVAADQDGGAYDIYRRSGGQVELVSTGPQSANTPHEPTWRASTPDGTHAYFETKASLVSGDSDNGAVDVYEWTPSATTLISTGPESAQLNTPATFAGRSVTGSHVFFDTAETLTTDDLAPGKSDVYERVNDETRLVSTGPNPSGSDYSSFAGTSADGSRVFFGTHRSFFPGIDSDFAYDIYERADGKTQRVTPPEPDGVAYFSAYSPRFSADGSVVVFNTQRPLLVEDSNDANAVDVYRAKLSPPTAPPACSDGEDNDGDGLADWTKSVKFGSDPGCSSPTDDDETNLPACSDGSDNDGDGKTDFPADPGCSTGSDTSEADPPVPPACSDGKDNDGDGKTDSGDPGCAWAGDTSEADPPEPPACSDGKDNDKDGKTDSGDPGCAWAGDTSEIDPSAPPECSDGEDNDEDGRTDFSEDRGCTSTADGSENSESGAQPDSDIVGLKRVVKARKLRAFRGTASDIYGVRRVELALIMRGGYLPCNYFTGKRFKGFRSSNGRCLPKFRLVASGTTRWTYKLKRRLPRGRYILYSRAARDDGTFEHGFSAPDHNRISFRVR